HSVEIGKEAGYLLPGGVGEGEGVAPVLEVAARSDQPSGDTSEAGADPAHSTKSTAPQSSGVEMDLREGGMFRRSAPDGLSSRSGVGARVQESLVQVSCRGGRCSRPADAIIGTRTVLM
ncbi:unnamed protein product, partial [Sphacelaria rigidula]